MIGSQSFNRVSGPSGNIAPFSSMTRSGFAVVAAEVKALANQTDNATGEIVD